MAGEEWRMKVHRARGEVVSMGVKVPSGLVAMEVLVIGVERVRLW